MIDAFWKGSGPAPGVAIWFDENQEDTFERSLKVLTGEPQIFDFRKWQAAVSLRQRLQWMENLYQSPNVLQRVQRAAQERPAPISWSCDPFWNVSYEPKMTNTPWDKATPQEIIDQLEWYLRGQYLDPS